MTLLLATLGLLVAVLGLLALPLELRFQVQGISPWRGQVALRAFCGLWRMTLASPTQARGRSRAAAPSHDRSPPPPGRQRPAGRQGLRGLWRDAALRRRSMRRLHRALAALHWHELHLHLRLGLDDPADTGRLWAVLGPLGAWLSTLRIGHVALEPDFVEPGLVIDAKGRLVVAPLKLVLPLALMAADVGLATARQGVARAPRPS